MSDRKHRSLKEVFRGAPKKSASRSEGDFPIRKKFFEEAIELLDFSLWYRATSVPNGLTEGFGKTYVMMRASAQSDLESTKRFNLGSIARHWLVLLLDTYLEDLNDTWFFDFYPLWDSFQKLVSDAHKQGHPLDRAVEQDITAKFTGLQDRRSRNLQAANETWAGWQDRKADAAAAGSEAISRAGPPAYQVESSSGPAPPPYGFGSLSKRAQRIYGMNDRRLRHLWTNSRSD